MHPDYLILRAASIDPDLQGLAQLLPLPISVCNPYRSHAGDKDEGGLRGTCRGLEFLWRQGLAWKAAVLWVSLSIFIVPVAALLLVRGVLQSLRSRGSRCIVVWDRDREIPA
jgi:hypothetical protein